jgi:hypothetical protein
VFYFQSLAPPSIFVLIKFFLSLVPVWFNEILQVAGLMYEIMKPKVVGLLNLVLWLLSTSFGTFLLSGRNGLGSTFPWFHKFSALSQERRERILISWAQSSLSIFQAVYKVFKGLTQFVFYSKVGPLDIKKLGSKNFSVAVQSRQVLYAPS